MATTFNAFNYLSLAFSYIIWQIWSTFKRQRRYSANPFLLYFKVCLLAAALCISPLWKTSAKTDNQPELEEELGTQEPKRTGCAGCKQMLCEWSQTLVPLKVHKVQVFSSPTPLQQLRKMHCLTVCSARDRCVLLQALFQCLMYLRIMQMTWEIHEYVWISKKIHQHASKESPSTNEARNKTPKQQQLWNNHISRYDNADVVGEVCTAQSWN